MSVEITMPQLSDTMSEGTILSWRKQEGDTVKRGDALAEVATDKADLEIESFHEGTLMKILAPQGTTVKVGSIIAVIAGKGETVSVPVASSPVAPVVAPSSVAQAPGVVAAATNGFAKTEVAQVSVAQVSSVASQAESERVKISPLAKKIAKSHGVDYSAVSGSGEGGRIVRRDVEKVIGSTTAPQAAPVSPAVSQPQAAELKAAPARAVSSAPLASVEPLSKMRQTIAARMVEATSSIPHFYVTAKVRVEPLIKLKTSLKPLPQYEGLTYNHLIIKAAALTLRVVPRVNAAFKDNQLIQSQSVNIGIVTAVPDGLLIPVIKSADELSLADIVSDGRGLVQRARAGRPKPEDLVGGTFSISNMGIFDVESFTAIISPGQGAILAVAPIQEEALVVDGQLRAGHVMRLTLSVDHRIIDGVVAGEFLTEIKRLLEDPVLLLA